MKELSSEFNFIGRAEAQRLNGGYSWDEMEAMMAAGTWTGGQVDGTGYVGPVVTGTTSSIDYGTVGNLLDTVGSSYADVLKDVAGSAASDWFPPLAYYYDGAEASDDVIKVAQDNATKESIKSILRRDGINIDSEISWAMSNNHLTVWDNCGNQIYHK